MCDDIQASLRPRSTHSVPPCSLRLQMRSPSAKFASPGQLSVQYAFATQPYPWLPAAVDRPPVQLVSFPSTLTVRILVASETCALPGRASAGQPREPSQSAGQALPSLRMPAGRSAANSGERGWETGSRIQSCLDQCNRLSYSPGPGGHIC